MLKKTVLWLLLVCALSVLGLGCAQHYYDVPTAAQDQQTADEMEWGNDPWR